MLKHALIVILATALLFKSGFFLIATAVPLLYLFLIYGRLQGWISALAMICIAAILLSLGVLDRVSVIYFCYFIMIGSLLGEGILKKTEPFKLSTSAVITPLALGLGLCVVLQYGMGIKIWSYAAGFFHQAVNDVLDQSASAALNTWQIAYIKENKDAIVDFMLKTTPAMAFLFNMLVVSVTILLSRSLTKKKGSLKNFTLLAGKSFPFWLVWAAIGFSGLFFADTYFLHNEFAKYLAVNGLMILGGVYFIQGCFVIAFWLKKGRSPFLRLVIYGLLIAFLQIVAVVIIALGLSDHWINFRKKASVTTA